MHPALRVALVEVGAVEPDGDLIPKDVKGSAKDDKAITSISGGDKSSLSSSMSSLNSHDWLRQGKTISGSASFANSSSKSAPGEGSGDVGSGAVPGRVRAPRLYCVDRER